MITLTNLAKSKLSTLIKQNGKSALLYLKSGGCNGFSYNFDILQEDKRPEKLDEKYSMGEYNLYLCNKSIMYLLGTKIDYIEDIMGSRFDFSNDNMQSKCGCGTSFNMKTKK